MQVWESLGHPVVERKKDTGKAESPSRTEAFVSEAMVVVFVTEAYEETA